MGIVADRKTVRERVEDGMREVGTLLMTFAPLDAALAQPRALGGLLIFLLVGAFFFTLAVVLEARRGNTS
jgi:hypothetical protein